MNNLIDTIETIGRLINTAVLTIAAIGILTYGLIMIVSYAVTFWLNARPMTTWDFVHYMEGIVCLSVTIAMIAGWRSLEARQHSMEQPAEEPAPVHAEQTIIIPEGLTPAHAL